MQARIPEDVAVKLRPRCPHARLVRSVPGDRAIVCGVMEHDQSLRDAIVEGGPQGVVVTERDDPSTFALFCCGPGDPSTDPDDLRAHYSCCPIYAADREMQGAGRLFAPETPTHEPTPHWSTDA